jgi:cellobiose-specific phosphotransferase system component IIC
LATLLAVNLFFFFKSNIFWFVGMQGEHLVALMVTAIPAKSWTTARSRNSQRWRPSPLPGRFSPWSGCEAQASGGRAR